MNVDAVGVEDSADFDDDLDDRTELVPARAVRAVDGRVHRAGVVAEHDDFELLENVQALSELIVDFESACDRAKTIVG